MTADNLRTRWKTEGETMSNSHMGPFPEAWKPSHLRLHAFDDPVRASSLLIAAKILYAEG
jgi:hypothetical protein